MGRSGARRTSERGRARRGSTFRRTSRKCGRRIRATGRCRSSKRRKVEKLDVKTKRSNRLKFTPDGKLVLISDMGTGELVIVDAAARREVKRLPLGKSAEGILVQPDGSRAFVAVSGDNKIAVVDLKTLEVT